MPIIAYFFSIEKGVFCRKSCNYGVILQETRIGKKCGAEVKFCIFRPFGGKTGENGP